MRAYAIPVVACAATVVVWGLRLPISSLWIDETITFWISSGEFQDMLERSVQYQNNGPLYFISVWPFVHLLPKSEAGLRLLSALCFLTALIVLFKLARLCLNTEGAVTATLLFITGEGVISTMATARPYALSLLLIIACAYSMILWLNRFKFRHLSSYVITGILSFYAHYLLAFVLFVFSIYMLGIVFGLVENRRKRKLQTCTALGILAILAIPATIHLNVVQARKEILHFSGMPKLDSLLAAWIPIRLLIFFIASAIIVWFLHRHLQINWRARTPTHVLLLLAWYSLPPLFLFLFSHFMNAAVLNPRYIIWCVPAGAILAAYIITFIKPKPTRRLFICLTISGLALVAAKNDLLIEHWSDAIHYIRRQPDLSHTTVLASTMLVEAADTTLLKSKESQAYLLSPFSFYPLDKRPVPLPLWFDQDGALKYLDAEVRPALAVSNRLILIARIVDMHSKPDRTSPMVRSDMYVAARLSEYGWKIENQFSFGTVTVIRFQRQH